jgi:hypothetical protein
MHENRVDPDNKFEQYRRVAELFQAKLCRSLGAECRQLAMASESKREKSFLTNLALSWNRIANQTDRYAEFLKNSRKNER